MELTRFRRVIGVGTVLTLMLGIADIALAPAAGAVAPVVIVAAPLTGPVGTSVTITGLGFDDSSVVTGVAFNGIPAVTFTVDSNTQVTAVVPVGATTGPVSVTDSQGTGATLVDFVVTPSPPPTVGVFLPTSGPAGTSVTIAGVGFTGASSVTFNGTSASFSVNSDIEIVATVPIGATTGPVSVTTPGGTGASLTDFTVTAPTQHARSVSLKLRRNLIAAGQVVTADSFGACEANVPVRIERRAHRHWHAHRRSVTRNTARYRASVSHRAGVFRAVVPRRVVNGGQDVCVRAVSRIRRHR